MESTARLEVSNYGRVSLEAPGLRSKEVLRIECIET